MVLAHSELVYTIPLSCTEFLCRFLCKPYTPPQATMSTESLPRSSETLTLQPLRPGELVGAEPHRLSWLWDGYLAPGKITALISPPKTGKTTLLSHLLRASLTADGWRTGRWPRPAPSLSPRNPRPTGTLAAGSSAWVRTSSFSAAPFRGLVPPTRSGSPWSPAWKHCIVRRRSTWWCSTRWPPCSPAMPRRAPEDARLLAAAAGPGEPGPRDVADAPSRQGQTSRRPDGGAAPAPWRASRTSSWR